MNRGLFVPVNDLPSFLQPLSYLLPLTYGADILNGAFLSQWLLNVWMDIAVLVGFTVVLKSLELYLEPQEILHQLLAGQENSPVFGFSGRGQSFRVHL